MYLLLLIYYYLMQVYFMHQRSIALYILVHGVEYVDEKSERSVNIYILCLSGH